MVDATALIAGPYLAPAVRRGDWLDDAIDGRVEVGGYSAGRIPWPKRKKTGRASLILCGELVRAVRTESAEAVRHWWGIGLVTVWKWRVALGVDRQNCEGTQRLYRELKPEKLSDEASARGREAAAGEEARARLAETKRGVPASPSVKAGLLRAAKAKKPGGWGKRANEWMLEGKRKK